MPIVRAGRVRSSTVFASGAALSLFRLLPPAEQASDHQAHALWAHVACTFLLTTCRINEMIPNRLLWLRYRTFFEERPDLGTGWL
jgi:hypothetical protein